MKKNLILFSLVVASISSANAGFVCQVSCVGKVDTVIDGSYKADPLYAQFEARCKSSGGTVKSGGSGSTYGFDAMNCWLPDSYHDYGKTYSYCVLEEKVQASGFGLTAIPQSGGGHFTASDSAYGSCHKNLERAACDNDNGPGVKAHDIVDSELTCREINGYL